MSNNRTDEAEPMPSVPLKVCYTIKEAVAATGLSRPTLYRAMAAGDLCYSQVGTRRRFLPEHLHEFLKRCEKSRSIHKQRNVEQE
jgi:excisionase family DNA binding protein